MSLKILLLEIKWLVANIYVKKITNSVYVTSPLEKAISIAQKHGNIWAVLNFQITVLFAFGLSAKSAEIFTKKSYLFFANIIWKYLQKIPCSTKIHSFESRSCFCTSVKDKSWVSITRNNWQWKSDAKKEGSEKSVT